MTDTTLPAEAERYLRQLELESAVLPELRQRRLLDQIREHLTDALDDDDDVRAVLQRLGSPRDLVAEATPTEASSIVPDAAAQRPLQAAPAGSPTASPRSPLLVTALVIGFVCVLLGSLALVYAAAMFAMTNNPRSMMLPMVAVVLLPAGIAMLLPVRRALRRERS